MRARVQSAGVSPLYDDGMVDLPAMNRDGSLRVASSTNTIADLGIGHGVKTVTTAGTDVALAASTAVQWVMIQAQTDNTSMVAVGASGVDATEATGTGILLSPGDAVTLPVADLADVYIDALVNGEGVRFTYGT